jgi:hypothetical protein
MKFYTTPEFISSVAHQTNKSIVLIQAEGSCASSMFRYRDIAVPEDVQREMIETGQAFLVFANEKEAQAKFHEIISAYPERTTLTLILTLSRPGHEIVTWEYGRGVTAGVVA